MKLVVRTLLVLWLTGWTSTPALAEGASYRVEVAGLACPFCAYGIEKKLSSLEGVERVDTHIKESVVIVTMTDDATLDKAVVKRAVEDAGFTLDGFERVSKDNTQ